MEYGLLSILPLRILNSWKAYTLEGDSPVGVIKEVTRRSILSTMRRYSRGNVGGMNIQP